MKKFEYFINNNEVTITDYGDFREGDVVIPDTIEGYPVTGIGYSAFRSCTGLTSKTGCYKALCLSDDGKISCRGHEFTENEWSDEVVAIVPCSHGYHFCTNLFEIFNYYAGEIDKDVAIYLCEAGDRIIRCDDGSSKHVTNRIKPVQMLYRQDVIKILNGG